MKKLWRVITIGYIIIIKMIQCEESGKGCKHFYEFGILYNGEDILFDCTHAKSPDECQNVCKKLSDCHGWVWGEGGGERCCPRRNIVRSLPYQNITVSQHTVSGYRDACDLPSFERGWTNWSPCSSSCEEGIQERRCINPSNISTEGNCEGEAHRKCHNGTKCETCEEFYEVGVLYQGNDIFSSCPQVSSARECQKVCQRLDECHGWTWGDGGRESCCPKSSIVRSRQQHVISGYRDACQLSPCNASTNIMINNPCDCDGIFCSEVDVCIDGQCLKVCTAMENSINISCYCAGKICKTDKICLENQCLSACDSTKIYVDNSCECGGELCTKGQRCTEKQCLKGSNGGWSSFGPCTQTCGLGIRKRTCTNPKPDPGANGCEGVDQEFCLAKLCPCVSKNPIINNPCDCDGISCGMGKTCNEGQCVSGCTLMDKINNTPCICGGTICTRRETCLRNQCIPDCPVDEIIKINLIRRSHGCDCGGYRCTGTMCINGLCLEACSSRTKIIKKPCECDGVECGIGQICIENQCLEDCPQQKKMSNISICVCGRSVCAGTLCQNHNCIQACNTINEIKMTPCECNGTSCLIGQRCIKKQCISEMMAASAPSQEAPTESSEMMASSATLQEAPTEPSGRGWTIDRSPYSNPDRNDETKEVGRGWTIDRSPYSNPDRNDETEEVAETWNTPAICPSGSLALPVDEPGCLCGSVICAYPFVCYSGACTATKVELPLCPADISTIPVKEPGCLCGNVACVSPFICYNYGQCRNLSVAETNLITLKAGRRKKTITENLQRKLNRVCLALGRQIKYCKNKILARYGPAGIKKKSILKSTVFKWRCYAKVSEGDMTESCINNDGQMINCSQPDPASGFCSRDAEMKAIIDRYKANSVIDALTDIEDIINGTIYNLTLLAFKEKTTTLSDNERNIFEKIANVSTYLKINCFSKVTCESKKIIRFKDQLTSMLYNVERNRTISSEFLKVFEERRKEFGDVAFRAKMIENINTTEVNSQWLAVAGGVGDGLQLIASSGSIIFGGDISNVPLENIDCCRRCQESHGDTDLYDYRKLHNDCNCYNTVPGITPSTVADVNHISGVCGN